MPEVAERTEEKYELLSGRFIQDDGSVADHEPNKIKFVRDVRPLDKMFPNKFRRIGGSKEIPVVDVTMTGLKNEFDQPIMTSDGRTIDSGAAEEAKKNAQAQAAVEQANAKIQKASDEKEAQNREEGEPHGNFGTDVTKSYKKQKDWDLPSGYRVFHSDDLGFTVAASSDKETAVNPSPIKTEKELKKFLMGL